MSRYWPIGLAGILFELSFLGLPLPGDRPGDFGGLPGLLLGGRPGDLPCVPGDFGGLPGDLGGLPGDFAGLPGDLGVCLAGDFGGRPGGRPGDLGVLAFVTTAGAGGG